MPRSTGDKRADAALRKFDERDAEHARAAIEWLTGGDSLDTITLYNLAHFLWYSLPVKWLTDLDEKVRVATALGEVFRLLDRSKYAELCHSAETRRILAAYERDLATGKAAYRKAMDNVGVQPPDVPGVLAWGTVMLGAELQAFRAAAVALEKAMDDGEFKPGAAGWRRKAELVTERLLNSPRGDVPGTTWLQWLNTGRLHGWVETGGPTRRKLAADLADDLIHPIPVPFGAADHIGPLWWLLEQAAAGAPLTDRFYLARQLVVEATERFGWQLGPKTPRSETHVAELFVVRDFAHRLKLIRRSERTLLLTKAGRTIFDGGPEAVWRAAMSEILGESDAERAAGEVAGILLLSDCEYTYGTLTARIAEILAESGWRDAETGVPIDRDGAASLFAYLSGHLRLFSCWEGRPWNEPMVLNEAGRAAIRTALRATALGPSFT